VILFVNLSICINLTGQYSRGIWNSNQYTNIKKYAASKDLPEKESVIEILESQKRVLEKIKEILTS